MLHNTELLIREAARNGALRSMVTHVANTHREQVYVGDKVKGTVYVYYFDLDGEPGFTPEIHIVVNCDDYKCECCGYHRMMRYRANPEKYIEEDYHDGDDLQTMLDHNEYNPDDQL